MPSEPSQTVRMFSLRFLALLILILDRYGSRYLAYVSDYFKTGQGRFKIASVPDSPPTTPSLPSNMATRIKQFARKVVGADKDPQVGVVRTVDVLKANGTKPVPFVLNYLKSLFPILSWIGKYNLGWLSGDLIAGEYLSRTPTHCLPSIADRSESRHYRRRYLDPAKVSDPPHLLLRKVK